MGHQVAEHLLAAAQLAEFGEDQPDAVLDTPIGVEAGYSVGVTDQARRQVLDQLAPPGLREPPGVEPQADTMELRLG